MSLINMRQPRKLNVTKHVVPTVSADGASTGGDTTAADTPAQET